jgi:hypothetical protein
VVEQKLVIMVKEQVVLVVLELLFQALQELFP